MQVASAAVVERAPGLPVIVDIEVGEPGPGEVLIRTAAVGICHTDIHGVHGHAVPATPFVLGHESAGVVEQVGAGVRHVAPGDHVVTCAAAFCGHCINCVTGKAFLCFTDEHARQRGEGARLTRNGEAVQQFLGLGGLATHMLVGQNMVVKIREDMALDLACLLGCGVVTGVGAVLNAAKVAPGQSVAVIGCGGVGLAVLQGAQLAYAGTIIAVDLDDQKLGLAAELGATHSINAKEGGAVEAVRELSSGGVDHVFEVVGSDATRRDAIAMSGRGGTITLVGMIDPAAEVTLTGADIMAGRTVQKTIFGSSRFIEDIPRLVDHHLAGRLDLGRMVTARRTLDEVPEILRGLEAGEVLGRTVVTF